MRVGTHDWWVAWEPSCPAPAPCKSNEADQQIRYIIYRGVSIRRGASLLYLQHCRIVASTSFTSQNVAFNGLVVHGDLDFAPGLHDKDTPAPAVPPHPHVSSTVSNPSTGSFSSQVGPDHSC